MKVFMGYLRTIYQYLQTPKGKHDVLDYLRAFGIILLTIVLVFYIVSSL